MSELLIETKVEKIRNDVETLQQALDSIQVTNDDELGFASEKLNGVKARIKKINALKKEFTASLTEEVKRIKNLFDAEKQPYEKMETELKRKISEYWDKKEAETQAKLAEERRKAEEERKKAEEEARKKAEAAAEAANEEEKKRLEEEAKAAEAAAEAARNKPVEVEQPQTTARSAAGTVSSSKVWNFKVTDESKVPRKFLKVDTSAIRKAMNAGEREIEGVEFFQERRISARS